MTGRTQTPTSTSSARTVGTLLCGLFGARYELDLQSIAQWTELLYSNSKKHWPQNTTRLTPNTPLVYPLTPHLFTPQHPTCLPTNTPLAYPLTPALSTPNTTLLYPLFIKSVRFEGKYLLDLGWWGCGDWKPASVCHVFGRNFWVCKIVSWWKVTTNVATQCTIICMPFLVFQSQWAVIWQKTATTNL